MTEHEQKWRDVKARFDALDDGWGAWDFEKAEQDKLWPEFKELAESYLGQGFSLACLEGRPLDNTTAYAFRFFKLGRQPKKEEDATSN